MTSPREDSPEKGAPAETPAPARPRVEARLPGFLQPSRPPAAESLPSPSSLSSRPAAAAAGEDEPGGPSWSTTGETTTSSPASTEDSAGQLPPPAKVKVDPELERTIADAVGAGGELLNERFGQGTELWLTDERDEQGIAKPVARIFARHVPGLDLLRAGNPDVADAIAAAAVFAVYLIKQVRGWRQLRDARRAAALYDPQQVPDPAGA